MRAIHEGTLGHSKVRAKGFLEFDPSWDELIFAVDTACEVGNTRMHERAHRLAKKPSTLLQIGRAEIAAWHFQRAELRRYIVPSSSPGMRLRVV